MIETPPLGKTAPDGDWTEQAAARIEGIVATVRDKTVGPSQKVARYIVYGLVAGCFLSVAAFLGAIALFRILNVYLPGGVWAADLFVGSLFIGSGIFLWSKRINKHVSLGSDVSGDHNHAAVNNTARSALKSPIQDGGSFVV